MKLNNDNKINIKQILMNNGKPSFVEFFSEVDSRNHILKSESFADAYGYTLEELALMAFKGTEPTNTALENALQRRTI